MSPSEEPSPPNDNIHGELNPQSLAKKISSEKALPRRSVTFLELLLETNDDCWGSWMDEKAEHLLYGSMNQGYMMQCQKWLFPHWNGRTKDWVLSPCGRVFGEIRRTFTVAETVDLKVVKRPRKLWLQMYLLWYFCHPVLETGEAYSQLNNNSFRGKTLNEEQDWTLSRTQRDAVDAHLAQTNQIVV